MWLLGPLSSYFHPLHLQLDEILIVILCHINLLAYLLKTFASIALCMWVFLLEQMKEEILWEQRCGVLKCKRREFYSESKFINCLQIWKKVTYNLMQSYFDDLRNN